MKIIRIDPIVFEFNDGKNLTLSIEESNEFYLSLINLDFQRQIDEAHNNFKEGSE